MYRFLLTPRWLAAAALTVTASVVMVFLGNWQLHRYQERSAINARIDAAESAAPVPMTSVLVKPTAAGQSGPSAAAAVAWTKVTVTGTFDPAHEIQARGRTVDGTVGFEIVTPLVLPDGTAVLVDRGWVPPAEGGAVAAPVSSAPPSGEVTVVGQIHRSESRPAPLEHRDGRIDTRRIAVPRLAGQLPYPVYGAYLLDMRPTEGFTRIPVDHEDAWQNAGYSVQWWMFALMALLAYAWQARREARGDTPSPRRDRVAEADHSATTDRVEAADRAASDRPASDRPASDRPASGRPAADRPAADHPAADHPAADRAASDHPASDRAASPPASAVPAARRPE